MGDFGIHFVGIPLLLIWVLEALIILATAFIVVHTYSISPYSMRTNKWYKKYELNRQFSTLVNIPVSQTEITNNVELFLEAMNSGEPFRHAIVNIYYQENEAKQYIKIDNLRYDRDGKLINTKTAINLQEISKQSAEQIIKKHNAKQSFFFD